MKVKKHILNLYNLWISFGDQLQRVVGSVVLFLFFATVICSCGAIIRILKKNYLNRSYDSCLNTYWESIPENEQVRFGDQF